jgi:hypothetical protein
MTSDAKKLIYGGASRTLHVVDLDENFNVANIKEI